MLQSLNLIGEVYGKGYICSSNQDMLKTGEINQLICVKSVEFGYYLDGGSKGEILLPKRYAPENLQPGDTIDVFIYNDSEDRLIATTEKPYAQVGEFSFLKITDVNKFGAFADWGLPKELLIPFSEQHIKLTAGSNHVVAVSLDLTTNRIIGSTKIAKFLDNTPPDYEENQEVDLLIWQKHELGFRVIINNMHSGMIYQNEIFQDINSGDILPGYIKKVREDEKIDCALQRSGFSHIDILKTRIIEVLETHNGTIDYTDKSDPELIKREFNCSKKMFKMALGSLYKEKKIVINPDKTILVKKGV